MKIEDCIKKPIDLVPVLNLALERNEQKDKKVYLGKYEWVVGDDYLYYHKKNFGDVSFCVRYHPEFECFYFEFKKNTGSKPLRLNERECNQILRGESNLRPEIQSMVKYTAGFFCCFDLDLERQFKDLYEVKLPYLLTSDGKQQFLSYKDGNFFASRKDDRLKQAFTFVEIPKEYRPFAREINTCQYWKPIDDEIHVYLMLKAKHNETHLTFEFDDYKDMINSISNEIAKAL